MAPYALFYHIISHVELAAAVARSKNTNTASPVFQAVLPSALRPEHVRLQTSETDCEPCLTPAHTTKVSLYRKHTQRFASEYIKSNSTHIEE